MKNLLIIICILTACLLLTSCSKEDSLTTTENIDEIESDKILEIEILELINNYRATIGLDILEQNNIIKSQTLNHSNYMMRQNSASHHNFEARIEYLRSNANGLHITENVARGHGTPQDFVTAWLNSPLDKQNIEKVYDYLDISVVENKDGILFITTIFMKIHDKNSY